MGAAVGRDVGSGVVAAVATGRGVDAIVVGLGVGMHVEPSDEAHVFAQFRWYQV